eukprot:TRINITY_DN8306_c0_g1_i1.p1 TRINITY_DN8306_c0_g1~~TRINITY_DN8306_c0_g1_i1.p1  ORF type:complete len:726 (-),score=72.44 TRINITY_DN8306_c0_g1_i1:123-2300(-)
MHNGMAAEPPELARQRPLSVPPAEGSYPTKLRREVSNARIEEHMIPPTLLRKRSNSADQDDILNASRKQHDWAGGPNAEPERAATVGGHTPRAARLETLEWEDSAAGGNRGRSGEQENIRVAARFRPFSERELNEGGADLSCVTFGDDGGSCTVAVQRAFGKVGVDFQFDNMFQPNATQEDVYTAVGAPIVEGVINGFNGAILAYGQTGSGKTHTMLGPNGAKALIDGGEIDFASIGLIPRSLQALVDYAQSSEGAVQLTAAYVEIYKEAIIDLLSPGSGGEALWTGSRSDDTITLPGVTQTPMGSVRQALECMRAGNKNRHVAETKMNRHSSRSHAAFIVTVVNSSGRFAQLYLVDLAGSERVMKTDVRGKQLDEAKDINKSLLALGQVIWALAHKQKHVNYRDSKLTLMLRNCLGGNARTAIVVACSPHETNANETLSSMRFGARASLIENVARMNIAEDPKELKRLLEQARSDLNDLRGHCRQLQAQVAAFGAVDYPSAAPPSPPTVSRSFSRQILDGPLQVLTSKRLLVWGLLPSLVCPLRRAVMRDPVCAADGWTYERRAIEKHFTRAGRTMPLSPVTGTRMSSRQLLPNLVVSQLVRQHLPDLHPVEVQLPLLFTLHIWHVQIILSFLDARSLSRSEIAWPSFMAAAVSSQAWERLAKHDFAAASISSQEEGGVVDDGINPRTRYARLRIAYGPPNPAAGERAAALPKTGLKLLGKHKD